MSSIPSNFGRVPDLYRSNLALANITRSNLDIFRVSNQISSGKMISKPSDDAVKSVAIAAIQSRLERSDQLSRNLQAAGSSLATIDQAFSEGSDLMLQAQSIASEQLNTGTSAEERSSQAVVVDSLIQGLFQIANRQSRVGYIFGGSQPGRQPFDSFHGGFRYVGKGPGLSTDLGIGGFLPVTLGGSTLMGSTSARVKGSVDLDPQLTADTRLSDLNGARGLGITTGSLTFSFDGSDAQTIDLSDATTISDVIDKITSALKTYQEDNDVTILGSGGVSFDGETLTIDVDDNNGENPKLTFSDIGTNTTAADLGLTNDDGLSFSSASGDGLGLGPKLTLRSPISSLKALENVDLGKIRLRGLGQVRVVDLSNAKTIEDIKNTIEAAGLGLRVEINDDATGINVLSEVATSSDNALAIEEVEDNNSTATVLGIRSFSTTTRLDDFNDGRGVRYITGSVNPETGQPDATLDVDFTITLGNGHEIDINFTPSDMATVSTMLKAINTQADASLTDAGIDPDAFSATLATDGNGIVLSQDTSIPGMTNAISIEPRNNSQAASDLGLLGGSVSADGSKIVGLDTAKVRPDNIFSWMLDLRNALKENDTTGIARAGDKISTAVDSIAESRALVGGYTTRVEQESSALEDRKLLDESLLSKLQDTDFAQAASKLALLQTQLSAAYQTTATAASLSLLNFLG